MLREQEHELAARRADLFALVATIERLLECDDPEYRWVYEDAVRRAIAEAWRKA